MADLLQMLAFELSDGMAHEIDVNKIYRENESSP